MDQWVQRVWSTPELSVEEWLQEEMAKGTGFRGILSLPTAECVQELQTWLLADTKDEEPLSTHVSLDSASHTYVRYLRESLLHEEKCRQEESKDTDLALLRATPSQDKLHVQKRLRHTRLLFPERHPPRQRVLVLCGHTRASVYYHCGVVARLWSRRLLHRCTNIWAEGRSACALACVLHDQWELLTDYNLPRDLMEYGRLLGEAAAGVLRHTPAQEAVYPKCPATRAPTPLLSLYEDQGEMWTPLLKYVCGLTLDGDVTQRLLLCVSYAQPQALPPVHVGDHLPSVDQDQLQTVWEFSSALWKVALAVLLGENKTHTGLRHELVLYSCYLHPTQNHPQHVPTRIKRYVTPWIRHNQVYVRVHTQQQQQASGLRRYKQQLFPVQRINEPTERHKEFLVAWGQYVAKVVEDHMHETCKSD